MQVTREDLNPCTVQLSITCEPTEVQAGFDKALKKFRKSVKISGFRPGHAPLHMVERAVSSQQLYEQAADEIVIAGIQAAVKSENLEPDPVTRPSVQLDSLEREKGECKFVAKVPLPAKVEVTDYVGLELEGSPVEVEDSEVDYQVEEIRRRQSVRKPLTDRGLEEGDVAVISIKAGTEAGEGKPMMVVVGQTFKDLDESLKGLHAEEIKSAKLKFPKEFVDKALSGKTKEVKITVNSASAVQLPELDADFAQSLKVDSIEDLKTKIKDQLKYSKESMNRELMLEKAMDLLVEKSSVEVSDNSWEDIANRRLMETAQEQRQNGKSMEDYATENGMTLDELVQAWKEKAKLYIQRAFIIREIFEKEKMTLTNPDINMELILMAQEYRVSPEEMVNILQKNNALEEVRFRTISRKVGDFLLSKAVVKEPAASA